MGSHDQSATDVTSRPEPAEPPIRLTEGAVPRPPILLKSMSQDPSSRAFLCDAGDHASCSANSDSWCSTTARATVDTWCRNGSACRSISSNRLAGYAGIDMLDYFLRDAEPLLFICTPASEPVLDALCREAGVRPGPDEF